VFEVEQFTIAR
jgi:hypothetical protein